MQYISSSFLFFAPLFKFKEKKQFLLCDGEVRVESDYKLHLQISRIYMSLKKKSNLFLCVAASKWLKNETIAYMFADDELIKR